MASNEGVNDGVNEGVNVVCAGDDVIVMFQLGGCISLSASDD